MPYRKAQDCTISIAGVTVIRATDVTVSRGADEIETTTRNDGVNKSKTVGHNEWGITLGVNFFIDDSAISTIRTAMNAQTQVAVALTSGVGGSESGSAYITRFDENQPLGDIVKVDVELIGDGALA